MSEAPVICTLPVFTSPAQQITFYADDPTSYQQVLTILNPCEFPVRFQILVQSSDLTRYSLNVPHGFIKAQHRVLVIIQHNSITSSSIGVMDKLKISMSCKKPGISFNKKELPMILFASRGQSTEPILSLDSADYISHQSAETKSLHSSRQHAIVTETRHGSDTDIVKKFQGYLIAFILGFLVCMWWKS
ncbi:motile sperm domain-containing protein 1 [Parasteatoda tepidariorum]|uniref:motile sperm domain-containing protein 1 n=1 Tax=Parasteatoda tepidariorum TaxID=114398 RepID=UPI001C71D991|nr:motile sperm domain-containing protein 1 [Parasteatoda tepidariorum]XP_042898686.1 motile sperm domain-containing protein 1 [Parasteatoda tepidariorum]